MTLGRTLEEIEETMSSAEFKFWEKYFVTRPEPEKRITEQLAYLQYQQFLHYQAMAGKRDRSTKIGDFVLKYEKPKKVSAAEKVKRMQMQASITLKRKEGKK